MNIEHNIVNKSIHAERRYVRLKEKFSEFARGAEYCLEPRCEVKGVVISISENREYFDALFATIQVRFQFTVCYAADNSLRGKVICILQTPSFTDTKKIIGTFTFNGQGEADFEVPAGADKIELGYSAVELVLHFLDKGIRQCGEIA